MTCIGQLRPEVTQRHGDHFFYQCDGDTPYNIYHKYVCNVSITAEISKKLLTFHSLHQNPPALKCNECSTEQLPRTIFTSFKRLQRVDLSNSGIKSVSSRDIQPASELQTLDLSGNLIEQLSEPRVFANATKLFHLDLSHNRLQSLDAESFYGIAQLEVLLLDSNQLDSLAPTIFATLPQLRTLQLHRNRIQSIQYQHVQDNKLLLELTLHENLMQNINDSMFDHLKQLQLLDLSDNKLQSSIRLNMKAVSVRLRNNNITYLTVGSGIQRLNASGNQLADANLTDAVNIVRLNLSSNLLTQLWIRSLPQLKSLDATGNAIERIHFIQTPKLRELSLASNKLESLQNLTHLSDLVKLDVSFNRIADMELFPFSSMEKLESLSLEGLGLTSIQFGAFSFQHRLKRLDISYNNFTALDLNVFYTISTLNELYVDGNNLRELNFADIRFHFPNLGRIGISDNSWNCTELIRIVRTLANMNISVHIDRIVKHRANVKGIGCISPDVNKPLVTHLHRVTVPAAKTLTVVPRNDTNEIKLQIDDLKKKFEQRLDAYELMLQSINATLQQDRLFSAENIHVTNNIFNERINDKFEVLSQNLQSLAKRLNVFVVMMAMDKHKDIDFTQHITSKDSNKNLIP